MPRARAASGPSSRRSPRRPGCRGSTGSSPRRAPARPRSARRADALELAQLPLGVARGSSSLTSRFLPLTLKLHRPLPLTTALPNLADGPRERHDLDAPRARRAQRGCRGGRGRAGRVDVVDEHDAAGAAAATGRNAPRTLRRRSTSASPRWRRDPRAGRAAARTGSSQRSASSAASRAAVLWPAAEPPARIRRARHERVCVRPRDRLGDELRRDRRQRRAARAPSRHPRARAPASS